MPVLPLLCLILAGANAAPSVMNRELKVRLMEEPRVLDWQLAATGLDAGVVVNLMEGLVRIGDRDEIVPALAESWETSNGGREITFVIRDGARWSDGVPIEARNFIDAWKRLLSPGTKAPWPSRSSRSRTPRNSTLGK